MRLVLFITSVYDDSKTGPATFARLLHKYFLHDGLNFKMITSDFSQEDASIIKVKGTLFKPWVYYKIWRKAKNIIRRYHTNEVIVHYNNSFPYLNFGRLGNRSIVQVNDYYNATMTIRNKSGLKWNVLIRHWLRKMSEANSLRKADRVICNSRYTMDLICSTYNIPAEKCRVIYKSVDADALLYKTQTIAKGRVIFVGNNYYLKGLDILIEALPHLLHTKELYIVGPAKLDAALQEKLNSNSSDIAIHITGAVKQPDLYQLMIDSDMLVIPARYEALGVSVVEAAAQGIPVITSGAGGLHEVLEQYPSICSDPDNLKPETLARHMNTVHEQYLHYKTLADAMAPLTRKKFDVHTMISMIYQEYESGQ